jgi:hypothetical protein
MGNIYSLPSINLNVIPGNQCVLFTWDNMLSDDAPITEAIGFLIRYRYDTTPIHTTDGHLAIEYYFSSGSRNYYIHKNIENGVPLYYRLWPISPDGTYGSLPSTLASQTPLSNLQFFEDLDVSYTKLNTNTRIYSRNERLYTADVVMWLNLGQEERKQVIINSLKNMKPAHTVLKVRWEPYYVAQTTTAQFQSGTFDSNVYTIVSGSIINKLPTIDASFGGYTTIPNGEILYYPDAPTES